MQSKRLVGRVAELESLGRFTPWTTSYATSARMNARTSNLITTTACRMAPDSTSFSAGLGALHAVRSRMLSSYRRLPKRSVSCSGSLGSLNATLPQRMQRPLAALVSIGCGGGSLLRSARVLLVVLSVARARLHVGLRHLSDLFIRAVGASFVSQGVHQMSMWTEFFAIMKDDDSQRPNHALQRTRRRRRGCKRCVPCAGSLSLGR